MATSNSIPATSIATAIRPTATSPEATITNSTNTFHNLEYQLVLLTKRFRNSLESFPIFLSVVIASAFPICEVGFPLPAQSGSIQRLSPRLKEARKEPGKCYIATEPSPPFTGVRTRILFVVFITILLITFFLAMPGDLFIYISVYISTSLPTQVSLNLTANRTLFININLSITQSVPVHTLIFVCVYECIYVCMYLP